MGQLSEGGAGGEDCRRAGRRRGLSKGRTDIPGPAAGMNYLPLLNGCRTGHGRPPGQQTEGIFLKGCL